MKHLYFGLSAFLTCCLAQPTIAQLSQNVMINEFMALNETTITDENGEYDDWIEIYNTTSSDINLSGYYITDDPMDSLRHEFPTSDSLIVPAGGHLLLWADGQPAQGVLHLNFRLSATGECILLSQPNTSTQEDIICFGPQTADVSAGRNGDGVIEWTFFYGTQVSPGASNGTTGVESVSNDEVIRFYPNPTKGNMVFSRSASGTIYNLKGKVLQRFTSQSTINLPYPPGTYILEIGRQRHKFIIQ